MGIISVPKKVYIATVSAEGDTPLNAFDNCLVKAGLGNVSLIKVTSVLPPKIKILEKPPRYPPGSNVPSIYAYTISSEPGSIISAAVALAPTENLTLVAEHTAIGKEEKQVQEEVIEIVKEMARSRNLKIENIIVKSVAHKVEKVGCALVVVAQM
ncbi:MAG: arginine decarboxylase, pyruvoyl-dependent [Crenarchaeota archaeon]|nr:arginine decarboxylase, pyruvoyl-dependent [Thermoproteota archaeon]MCR8455207.1 arginine decarboxylase, pyruvoyl-dependent [Thermoproteota archaeon]